MSFENMEQPTIKRKFFKTLLDTACQGIGRHLPDPNCVEEVAFSLENPALVDRGEFLKTVAISSTLALAACGRKEKQEKFDIDELISDLISPDSYTRELAASKLWVEGSSNRDITSATVALVDVALNDNNNSVRYIAAGAIGFVKPKSIVGIGYILEVFNELVSSDEMSLEVQDKALAGLLNFVRKNKMQGVDAEQQRKVMQQMLFILESDNVTFYRYSTGILEALVKHIPLSLADAVRIDHILNNQKLGQIERGILSEVRRVGFVE